MVKTRSQDGDSKGKELDVEDPMESRLSRLEDLFAERNKMMKQFADMVEAFSRSTAGKMEFGDDKPPNGEFGESVEHRMVNLVPEAQEENPKLENHEGWEQMVILEVEGDVEKGQEVQSMEKICSAHQVFDKMSLGVQSKRRQIKCHKSWRFKFKQRKQQRGKPRIAHKLIYKGILMIDSEDHLSSCMVKEIGIEISSDRWLSNSIGCELETGETVNDDYRVPSDSDLIMNDIEKDKERLKWKKRRKSLKTWRFKFKSRDMRGHNLCRVTLLLKNSLVITGSWRRSMMNNYEPVRILSELERKKKKLCLKTWMFKYKNVEFLKRMEAGSSMIMVLYNNTELINYLYPLEKSCLVSIIRIENALIEARFVKTMEEYSKNPLASTLAYELFHSPRPPELFVADRMIATKVEMKEDMNKDDQKPQGDWGHYCLLVAAANWSPQMNLWSTSYHVWHRWKARYCFVGIISTMWAWLFGEGGFDIGKEMTRGGSGLKKDQWLR